MKTARTNPFRREARAIDLTPLIDCVFLILTFFLITSSFTKKDLFHVQIPKVTKATTGRDVTKALDVYIDPYGGYRLGTDVKKIIVKEELRAAIAPHRSLPVVFKVDRKTPSEFLAYAIGVLFELQMDNFSIQVKGERRD